MSDKPSPQEIADVLRSASFALERGSAALVAFTNRAHTRAVARDFDRMREASRKVKALLEHLPAADPMSPERELAVGRMVAAALNKRLGDGTAEGVRAAVDAYFALDEPTGEANR